MATAPIEVKDLVAFNSLDDAVWFEVLDLDGHTMLIREAGTDYRPTWQDTSLIVQHQKNMGGSP